MSVDEMKLFDIKDYRADNLKLFDINDYLQEHGVVVTSVENKDSGGTRLISFKDLIKQVDLEFKSAYDSSDISDNEKSKRQLLEHSALVGDPQSESLLISDIESYLRENNLLGINFPDYYQSLAHGIFQELYRFGALYKWETYPDSPSAKIQGRELYFKSKGVFVKQPELLPENKIWEIIRLFQIGDSSFKVNEFKPQAEIFLETGVRIKVMIPPMVNIPTIVFRRFIVRNYSFAIQASLGTIPKEDVYFYELLSRLYLNTIIAGQVESGKSTMLKTVFSARDKDKTTILLESSPESFLKKDFPDRLIHEIYTDGNGEIQKLIRDVLRIDHDNIIMQEVRGIEAEGAIDATQRGAKGLLMTYHITNPRRTAEQLSQHIVDEFPNRRLASEIRRVSDQLDIGIVMKDYKGRKRLTDVYELCYDFKEDKAWINYLVSYSDKEDKWMYNSKISDGLKHKLENECDESVAKQFLNILNIRAEKYPYKGEPVEPIYFKEV